MAPWKEIKCRYFDPHTGERIGPGCKRGSRCIFIHPEDPEWEPSRRQPRSRSPIRNRKNSRSSSSSPRQYRRRSLSPPQRRNSTSYASMVASRRDPDISNDPPKQSRAASSTDRQNVTPAPTYSQPPASSSTPTTIPPRSMLPPPPPPPHPSALPPPLPPPHPPALPTPLPLHPPAHLLSLLPHSPAHPSLPPRPPAHPPSLPLPPPAHPLSPLPTAPASSVPPFDLIGNEPTLTIKDRRKTWINRVKLMTDSCAARKQILNFEHELQRSQNFIKSKGFQTLDADTKKTMEEKQALEQHQCDVRKGQLNDTLQQLLEMDDFWPAITKSNKEITSDVLDELRSEVTQLKALAEDSKRYFDPSHFTPDESTFGKNMGRLYISLEKKWEEFEDKLGVLENRADDQQNEVTQSEENITADLNEMLDKKIAELTNSWENRTGHPKRKLEELVSSHNEQSSKVADMMDKLENTQDIVSELKDEIAQLKNNTPDLDRYSTKLQEEQRKFGVAFARFEKQQIESGERVHKLERETAALTAAVQAHTGLLAQPGPPLLPPLEQILKATEEPLQERMREAIEPILRDHHAGVRAMLLDQNQKICTGVWDKLSLTLQMTELIYTWMRSMNNDSR